jgi:hypothetical protein
MSTDDTGAGNVTATGALTMYLDGDTIHGNVTSTGGGPGPSFDPYINFPIKDNTIDGNLICQGNTPAAQLGDSGGTENAVGKKRIGECAGL